MLKTSLVVLGIVLTSGGLALAQQSSSDPGQPPPPPKPKGHHHAPPPPPGGVALQGKGFDLELGHGRGLRVQCGDEQLKSCVQAVQPLLHQLRESHRPKPRDHGKRPMRPDASMNNGASMDRDQGQGASPSGSLDQRPPQTPDSSGAQMQ